MSVFESQFYVAHHALILFSSPIVPANAVRLFDQPAKWKSDHITKQIIENNNAGRQMHSTE